MPKEAKARVLITELLRKSGWWFFDDESGPANIALETHVKLKKKTLDAFADDFEKTASGYVDYLLLDERGFPPAPRPPAPDRGGLGGGAGAGGGESGVDRANGGEDQGETGRGLGG